MHIFKYVVAYFPVWLGGVCGWHDAAQEFLQKFVNLVLFTLLPAKKSGWLIESCQIYKPERYRTFSLPPGLVPRTVFLPDLTKFIRYRKPLSLAMLWIRIKWGLWILIRISFEGWRLHLLGHQNPGSIPYPDQDSLEMVDPDPYPDSMNPDPKPVL